MKIGIKGNSVRFHTVKVVDNSAELNVAYENKVKTNNGSILALLIEKYFTCLDNTIEDRSNNYPNPKANF